MNRKLTRRRFLEISVLGAAGLVAGCSANSGTYPAEGGGSSTGVSRNPNLDRLKENVVSGGPGKDGIPPIDDPKFVSAREMEDLLQPEDRVFVLEYKGETKVYPQPVLVWHEIANDEVAGEKLSVTYCPLTGSAVAFKGRSPNGDPLTFGTTGRLVNSNLLMYDRSTNSEWPQILGKAISGEMRESALQEVPLVWTTWEQWKARGTDAPVLSTDTGNLRRYGTDPYGSYSSADKGYYEDPGTFFEVLAESSRLPPKEVVLGVKAGINRHALRKSTVLEKGVWNLNLEDQAVVALADPALETVRVFDRVLQGDELEFSSDGNRLTDQRGRNWRRESLTLAGPNGATLQAANFYEVMWFAWYAFYPETSLKT